MVSGNDIPESVATGHESWTNPAQNSATSAYQSSQAPQDLNNVLGTTSTSTDIPLRKAPPGTMQDTTPETRTTPTRGTSIAISSTSAPNSLTIEGRNSTSPGKSRQS